MTWILAGAIFVAGIGVGLMIAERWIVQPLREAVLNMRIMGFDPVRLPPEQEPEEEFPEYNET